MPINVLARGGSGHMQNIRNLDANQATEFLRRTKTHVNLPNKSSGVFVLVNRSKNGTEMALKRKSGFQLFGRGQGNTRLNQTREFWDVMLRKAGLPDAADRLTAHLDSKPKSGHANRVDVAFIRDLLKDYNLDEPVHDDGPIVDMDDLMLAGQSPESFDLKQDASAKSQAPTAPQAALKLPEVSAAKAMPNESPTMNNVPVTGKSAQPVAGQRQLSELSQEAQPVQLPLKARPPLAVGKTLAEVRKKAGMRVGNALGSGSFGTVNLVEIGRDGTQRALKTFNDGQTPTLYRSRALRLNEATAAYLVSKKEAGYAQKAGVAETQYFTVNDGKGFQMLDSLGLRELLKRSPEGSVKLHEIVMEKVDGQEAFDHVVGGNLKPEQRKALTRQMLSSLKELNRRGFVVRDHKWENVVYDPKTNQAKLIDTGLFHKLGKARAENRFIKATEPDQIGGTLTYMHARALTGALHGSETDVYAQAIMTLVLEHPNAMGMIIGTFLKPRAERLFLGNKSVDKGLSSAEFKQTVRFASHGNSDNADLRALREAIEDPNSLSGLAMQCLDMANRPATRWALRSDAQAMFDELLAHPSVN